MNSDWDVVPYQKNKGLSSREVNCGAMIFRVIECLHYAEMFEIVSRYLVSMEDACRQCTLYQQKIYSSSCASDAQDAQDVNSHSGCDVEPTPCPEDSLNVPLRPDNVLKRTLRPVRPDAFRR